MHLKSEVKIWQFSGILVFKPNNWSKYITPVLLISKVTELVVLAPAFEANPLKLLSETVVAGWFEFVTVEVWANDGELDWKLELIERTFPVPWLCHELLAIFVEAVVTVFFT